MAAEAVQKSSFWEFKGDEEYIDELFLMRCPFPMMLLLGGYLLFVLKIGPEYMKNRPPFKIRKIIIAYNIFQVIYSVYLAIYGIQALLEFGLIERNACYMDSEPLKRRLTSGHHLYFLAKLTEFLDTIFFVLRKKWNQVSFLHVYHHTIMYTAAWTGLKYEPSYSMVFLGTLNSVVHTIMYGYYALSAFPKLRRFLWWKKYITKMQLAQFCAILVHIWWNTSTSTCPISYFFNSVCMFHGLLFIYLFTDFYFKSYKK